MLASINIPVKQSVDSPDRGGDSGVPPGGFQPHGLWLTREQTRHTEASSGIPREGTSYTETETHGRRGVAKYPRLILSQTEPQHRRAYLQVDLLNPGDVFVSRSPKILFYK